MADTVSDQTSILIANGSNGLGHGRKNINKKLFSKGHESDDVYNNWNTGRTL